MEAKDFLLRRLFNGVADRQIASLLHLVTFQFKVFSGLFVRADDIRHHTTIHHQRAINHGVVINWPKKNPSRSI